MPFSNTPTFRLPLAPLLGALLGGLLVLAGAWAYPQGRAVLEAVQQGQVAYGWLATPVSPGSPKNRAQALEELLADGQ
jgi:hypothetical protein